MDTPALSAPAARARATTCALVGLILLLAGSASAQATREYQLRWRVPPEPDVARYKVFVGAASRSYGTPFGIAAVPPDSSGVATTLLTGLDSGRDYYVAMTAVDGAGNESVVSNEVRVTALACTAADCDDNNSCTVDSCGATACMNEPVPDDTGCDDGNATTFFDRCVAGVCVGQRPQCTVDADCPDTDANVCNGGRRCLNLTCLATAPLVCPASTNMCQAASCNAATGCGFSNVANGTSCNDGNAGTVNDACSNGACTGTAAQCTSDAQCPDTDANVCTGVRRCQNFACVATAPRVCPASTNMCQAASCNAATGCGFSNVANGTSCNDGNAGTVNDACSNGACVGTTPQCTSNAQCPDTDANVCNGRPVCQSFRCVAGPLAPNGTTCDDGNASTLGDVCSAGLCAGRHECESNQDCRDPDASVCTGTPVCSGFRCVAGTPLVCPDAPVCGESGCNPSSGCFRRFDPVGTPCDDGNASTTGDVCVSDGMCSGQTPPPPPPPGDVCAMVYGAPTAQRLALGKLPNNEVTIVWDAPANPAGAEVRYRRAGGRTWFSVRGAIIRRDGCKATYAATLADLAPVSAYDYAVSGAGTTEPNWSAVRRFRTAPSPRSRASMRAVFVAGTGSPGAADANAAAMVRDRIAGLRPHLILGGGGYAFSNDVVERGLAPDASSAVARWFEQMTPALATAPFLPVLGDSEQASYWHGEKAAMYTERMPVPDGGTAPLGTYSYDVANAHFLAIDASTASALLPETADGAGHLAWIAADLAAARARNLRWIVVYLHVDLWSSEMGAAPVTQVRDALGRLFEQHRVNLVLSGDGNSMERTFPLVGGAPAARRTTGSVVYLRTGSSGRTAFGSWSSAMQPPTTAMRNNVQATHVLLSFEGREFVTVKTYGLDVSTGEARRLDAFVLR